MLNISNNHLSKQEVVGVNVKGLNVFQQMKNNLRIITFPLRRKIGLTRVKKKSVKTSPTVTERSSFKKKTPNVQKKHEVDVLIYGPIATAGLTTQVHQLVDFCKKYSLDFQITSKISPEIKNNPLLEYYVPVKQAAKPKIIFFLERMDKRVPGFENAFKVFYTNLDWLRPEDKVVGIQFADLVIHPVEYRFEQIKETFKNAKSMVLKWPAISEFEFLPPETDLSSKDQINVLYVGNDIDKKSRKHPYEVIESIRRCKNTKLKFWLKFRSEIPAEYKAALLKLKNVEYLCDHRISDEEMEGLYERCHVNLIPNASEGNGLSILEAIAKGVVPITLDGYPMKDVVKNEFGYRISCEQVGEKRAGPEYHASVEDIVATFEEITMAGLNEKRVQLRIAQSEFFQRGEVFEKSILEIIQTQVDIKGIEISPDQRIEYRRQYCKPVSQIDVYLTTCRRPDYLKDTLETVLLACDASPYNHRIFVMADNLDIETWQVLSKHIERISVITSNVQLGLPFMFNTIHDHHWTLAHRSEIHADFICYIQDDCKINYPEEYFETMVSVHEHFDVRLRPGYVSGFHCRLHPGFLKSEFRDNTVLLSDSIDGKNFMVRPSLLRKVGKLTWYDKQGNRRGNPGPDTGSHFDLWQWKESDNSLMKQKRTNLILPGLCSHLGMAKENSSWNNDTTESHIDTRIDEGRVYDTRDANVVLDEIDYYAPRNRSFKNAVGE